MKQALLAAFVAAACAQSFAATYYVVIPVPGKTVSREGIQVDLSSAQLPAVQHGTAYSYDFKPHLQVAGDPSYTGYGVK